MSKILEKGQGVEFRLEGKVLGKPKNFIIQLSQELELRSIIMI